MAKRPVFKRPVFNRPDYFPGGWNTDHGVEVEVADGRKHRPIGIGTAVCVVFDVHDKAKVWRFDNSIYDPTAPCNLLCVDRFHFDAKGNETDCFVNLKKHTVELDGVVEFRLFKLDGLPMLPIRSLSEGLYDHSRDRSAAALAKADGANGLVREKSPLVSDGGYDLGTTRPLMIEPQYQWYMGNNH